MLARFVTTQLYLFTDYFRLRLAALHFNKNSNKKQAKTRAGTDRYAISFSKYKEGGHIVWRIKEKSTYSKLTLKVANDAIINL